MQRLGGADTDVVAHHQARELLAVDGTIRRGSRAAVRRASSVKREVVMSTPLSAWCCERAPENARIVGEPIGWPSA